MVNKSGLYIHIPFCRSKCIYCDFYSAGNKIADWDAFTSALCKELCLRIEELEDTPDTLYLGGGTPSLLPRKNFKDLMLKIDSLFNNSLSWREATLEANPEDITIDNLYLWKDMGINRLSLGIQTFNEDELKRLRRLHSVETSFRAIEQVEKVFPNFSIDLMFGLPAQTIKSWEETLNRAFSITPTHISSYVLMLEEKTPMTLLVNQGKMELPDEKETLIMWSTLLQKIKENGYEHYEISNYAKPGYGSVHNSKYWNGNPYLGLGPGAHSYDGKNIRRWNPANLKKYLEFYSPNSSYKDSFLVSDINKNQVFYEEEILNVQELMEEYILTRLRKRDGFSISDFIERFGASVIAKMMKNINELKNKGLIQETEGWLRLSHKGIPISDHIFVDLLSF